MDIILKSTFLRRSNVLCIGRHCILKDEPAPNVRSEDLIEISADEYTGRKVSAVEM
jgi:hypothetical protein